MDILPILPPQEVVVLRKDAQVSDGYISNVLVPTPIAPFELIAFPLKSLDKSYDYTHVAQISCTVEFGYDVVATKPAFSLYASPSSDIVDQTAQSRDFVSGISAGYFSGSYCFVLTRGVDYDDTTESIHILVGSASNTAFTMDEGATLSASYGVSFVP